jgi:CheY-like chemotaxis protein
MPHEFHILLVEDTETDVMIIARALRDAEVEHRLTVIRDGSVALDYLLDLNNPDSEPELVPDLILLDLNLPGLDGYQLLSRIKSDPSLRILPVVVLTTSRQEEDVLKTYHAGANTFIQKPAEYPRYRELASALHVYWSDLALRVPRRQVPEG